MALNRPGPGKSAAIAAAAGTALQKQLREAKRALELADSIMAYCGGDRWEREYTADDRKKYGNLFKRIMGKDSMA